MAITSQATLLAAIEGGQEITVGGGLGNSVAQFFHAAYASTNFNGTTALAGTDATSGVVPTSASAGFPPIRSFPAGTKGYLARIEPYGVAARQMLVDLLWKAGTFPFNAAATLSGQPSFAARLPNGDYKGVEMWFEAVTVFTGAFDLTVTYTNQDGVAGQVTTVNIATVTVLGRCLPIPLAPGDSGVQKVESVTGATATAGTFNIVLLRKLFYTRVRGSYGQNAEDLFGPDRTGLPVITSDAALAIYASNDGGGSVNGYARVQIAVG